MITDSDVYILEQINAGLQIDLRQLHTLDATIRRLLDEARAFPGGSSEGAAQEWDGLTTDLSAIHDYGQQVDAALTTDTNDAKEHWTRIKEIDLRLEAHYTRLRDAGAATIAPERRQQWSDLWRGIFLNLGAIRAHAAVVQAAGEMRVRYGKVKADEMAQEILNHLPAGAKMGEAARYADEYRKAFDEYQANKEHFGGFFDVVRSLMMIPDEHPDIVARRRLSDVRQD